MSVKDSNLVTKEDTKKNLHVLNNAKQIESLWIDEDNHISPEGLAYLNIVQHDQADQLFLQLLQQSTNPITQAYAIAGLYQNDNSIINRLTQYPKIDTSIAVNLKIKCSLFVGLRLADVIDQIKYDDLHQQLISGQEKLDN